MTFSLRQAYGAPIVISLPATGNWSSTVSQKIPEERTIIYTDGYTLGTSPFGYTHDIQFNSSDCIKFGRSWTLINTTDYSTVDVLWMGVTSFSIPPRRTIKLFLNANNSTWHVAGRFTSCGLGTDSSATPSQYIVFGQAVSPSNGTYMYNPVADVWATKVNRPSSELDSIGGDVTTGSGSYGNASAHQTLHLAGTSTWQFNFGDSYTSKSAIAATVSHDAAVGVVDGGTKYMFCSTGVSGSSMQIKRYDTAANTWSSPSGPGGFNHDVGIAVETYRTTSQHLFLMFGTSGLSTKSIRAALGPSSSLTWVTFPSPSTGQDFASASIAALTTRDIYVFGGSQDEQQIAFGSNKLRINSRTTFSWRNAMSLPSVCFSQAAFNHNLKDRIYLMAGSNASTGSYQTHRYYDATTDSYTTTANRAWTNYGGYRHASRGRVNWMP